MNHLLFADDILLISGSIEELEEMKNELNREGRESGLEISIEKTKILGKKVNDRVISTVSYTHLTLPTIYSV